jgi:CDP-glucose 4,6-dehydratase
MHYLITGHTGFKGAWLTMWLTSLGHKVSGISLDPIENALFTTANLSELVENDLRIDIRNADETISAIKSIEPDVVFHLAAQPLVRESYLDPRGTFETNAMGTLNVLEGVSNTKSVKAHVVITTDKVYRNVNQVAGYIESDPLGGDDPYSASKAMADILTHSWVTSFPSPPTTIVRAGNVIGGGDVSHDRLMPDLINAYSNGKVPNLRYPNAVRPWQHVLDCLNGYLMIADHLLAGNQLPSINIGPDSGSFKTVLDVANLVAFQLSVEKGWIEDSGENPHEADLLALDANLAKKNLGWNDKLKFEEAINWTTEWYKSVNSGVLSKEISFKQVAKFIKI